METKLKESEMGAFKELTSKHYHEQAIWFLDAFWNEEFEGNEPKCEDVWKKTLRFIDVDWQKGKKGSELDEALSHKFLESLGETLTILELRKKLRQIDLDMNGYMSLTEYLVFFFKKSVERLLKPQTNSEELKAAMDAVAAAGEAQAASLAAAEQSSKAAQEAKSAKEVAERAHQEAKRFAEQQQAALDAVQKALDDADASLQALQQEEKKHEDKCNALKQQAESAPTAMKKGLALNELSQLQSVDPLPLRSAKINQGAAVRKVEKAKIVAEEAKKKAFQAEAASASAAKEAKRRSEEAELRAKEAEERKAAAEAAFKLAEENLEELKKKAIKSNGGSIWWAEREMEEIRKYRPGYKPKK